jgi:hypothetical protein
MDLFRAFVRFRWGRVPFNARAASGLNPLKQGVGRGTVESNQVLAELLV